MLDLENVDIFYPPGWMDVGALSTGSDILKEIFQP
jgi:hypothetical protein